MPMKGPDGTNTGLRTLNLWWTDHAANLTVALTTDSNRITFWNQSTDADPTAPITQVNLTTNNTQYSPVTVYLRADQPGDDVIHFSTADASSTKLAGDVDVTVVEVDLDVDTNNDGSIDTANTGEDRYEKYEPGVLVCKTIPGDADATFHHSVCVKLKIDGGSSTALADCKVTLTSPSPSANILYTSSTTQNSSTWVQLPKVWYDVSTVPPELYLSGRTIGPCPWQLSLTFKDPNNNTIKVDTIKADVVPYVNWAPAVNTVAPWCPFWKEGDPDSAPHSSLDTNILATLQGHGWDTNTLRFRDEQGDATAGSCTLQHFKNMASGGVIVLMTHGSTYGKVALVAFGEDDIAEATAWIGSESGLHATTWSWPKPGGDGDPDDQIRRRIVYAESDWFANNWKTAPDANRAMLVFLVCHANIGIVAACGGRVEAYYDDIAYFTPINQDMAQLFGRLTGGYGGATRNVKSIEAADPFLKSFPYNGVQYNSSFLFHGNRYTTLSPAPIVNGTYPNTTMSIGTKRGGCIVFDTYMNLCAATSALYKKAGTGAGSTVSGSRWVQNGNTEGSSSDFALSFDCDKAGTANITMHAEADQCRNQGQPTRRKMDGDRTTYGEDKEWSF